MARPDSSETPSYDGDASARADKYHILTELGQGGSGVVSLALSRGIGGFNKLVVLKTIRQGVRDRQAHGRRFLDEAKVAARMSHPNVVQTYEVYKVDDSPVIVMEYLDGQSLADVRKRAKDDPRLNEATTISILCKVLAGLHYAHALSDFRGNPLNLVHRDATPHNVLITYQGVVKLLDFGIAKLSASRDRTDTGVVKGKLDYMPPEQLLGEEVDGRADIFAVGVMLWEGIARQRMWEEAGDAEVMRRVLAGDIPAIRGVKAEIDSELERICQRALAPDPAERYATAAEFQGELERYMAARGGLVPEATIGSLVSESGAEHRHRLKGVIDNKLRRLTADSATIEETRRAIESLRTRGAEDSEIATASARTIELPKKSRPRWGWLAASACLLLSGGGFLSWRSLRPVASAPERGVSAPAALTPDTAKVSAELVRPEAGPAAAGSTSSSAVAPAAPLRVALAGAPRANARPKSPRSASNPCDPLYTIDEFGIKRYRRECLPGAAK
jgi:serine/threonine protein kinase